jgi:ribA/ribD-fused uncharacterized protein
MQNFYRRPMRDDRSGLTMCSSEAVYQSRKFAKRSIIQAIADAGNPYLAKKTAYQYPIENPLWTKGENIVQMKSVVLSKYKQHSDLAKLLLDTFPDRIYELSYKDDFWGTRPDKTGKNQLGLTLEWVRQTLMEEQNDDTSKLPCTG